MVTRRLYDDLFTYTSECYLSKWIANRWGKKNRWAQPRVLTNVGTTFLMVLYCTLTVTYVEVQAQQNNGSNSGLECNISCPDCWNTNSRTVQRTIGLTEDYICITSVQCGDGGSNATIPLQQIPLRIQLGDSAELKFSLLSNNSWELLETDLNGYISCNDSVSTANFSADLSTGAITIPSSSLSLGLHYLIARVGGHLTFCNLGLRISVLVASEDCNISNTTNVPCSGAGQCKFSNEAKSHVCDCCSGFTSRYCSEYDGCSSSPCMNNGNCTDVILGHLSNFTCSCGPYFTGLRCETPIDYCKPNPCFHNGSCISLPLEKKHICSCILGFNGTNCEQNIDDCIGHNCSVNSTCIDGVNSYNCGCFDGWTGQTCNLDVDECTSNPCQNNGTCNNIPGNFTCECPSGLSGRFCQKDLINECSSSPCQNSGSCLDLVGGFQCQCIAGFGGNRCEIDVDECASQPCFAEGTVRCQNLVGRYLCECIAGYTGRNCESDINECVPNPCQHGGLCVNLLNKYTCACHPGYFGETCQEVANKCSLEPCKNNATCQRTGDYLRNYACMCAPGWSGRNCTINIDECASSPCFHNGTCQDLINGYKCNCPLGWTDSQCRTNIDMCLSKPCHNGANCTDLVTGLDYTCTCPRGFAGKNCSHNIDECSTLLVNCNNGICVDLIDDYYCNCSNGWYGKHCDTDRDLCKFSPCRNGGSCENVNTTLGYTCTCKPGFTGINCSVNINECNSQPCKNNGTCNDFINFFNCSCAPGFTGGLCEINIDECKSSPCQKNGTCDDLINDYRCTCMQGYSGKDCNVNIDECISQPCQNNGTCIDGVNHFSCNCSSGYFGDLCEIPLCSTNPCKNGSTCNQRSDGYTCNCLPGFTGKHCDMDIDECLSSPCLHNGTCFNLVNQYSCNCSYPYLGQRCEQHICSAGICLNGGNCTELPKGFSCSCPENYNGTQCEIPIGPCTSNPCAYNGTCIEQGQSFHCVCPFGFDGPRCQQPVCPCLNGGRCILNLDNTTYCTCSVGYSGQKCETFVGDCNNTLGKNLACIDKNQCKATEYGNICECPPHLQGQQCNIFGGCEKQPCKNGAQCSFIEQKLSCTCPAGYTGQFCELDLNECLSNPCLNGAHCREQHINAFVCFCLEGFSGQLCQNGSWPSSSESVLPKISSSLAQIRSVHETTASPIFSSTAEEHSSQAPQTSLKLSSSFQATSLQSHLLHHSYFSSLVEITPSVSFSFLESMGLTDSHLVSLTPSSLQPGTSQNLSLNTISHPILPLTTEPSFVLSNAIASHSFSITVDSISTHSLFSTSIGEMHSASTATTPTVTQPNIISTPAHVTTARNTVSVTNSTPFVSKEEKTIKIFTTRSLALQSFFSEYSSLPESSPEISSQTTKSVGLPSLETHSMFSLLSKGIILSTSLGVSISPAVVSSLSNMDTSRKTGSVLQTQQFSNLKGNLSITSYLYESTASFQFHTNLSSSIKVHENSTIYPAPRSTFYVNISEIFLFTSVRMFLPSSTVYQLTGNSVPVTSIQTGAMMFSTPRPPPPYLESGMLTSHFDQSVIFNTSQSAPISFVLLNTSNPLTKTVITDGMTNSSGGGTGSYSDLVHATEGEVTFSSTAGINHANTSTGVLYNCSLSLCLTSPVISSHPQGETFIQSFYETSSLLGHSSTHELSLVTFTEAILQSDVPTITVSTLSQPYQTPLSSQDNSSLFSFDHQISSLSDHQMSSLIPSNFGNQSLTFPHIYSTMSPYLTSSGTSFLGLSVLSYISSYSTSVSYLNITSAPSLTLSSHPQTNSIHGPNQNTTHALTSPSSSMLISSPSNTLNVSSLSAFLKSSMAQVSNESLATLEGVLTSSTPYEHASSFMSLSSVEQKSMLSSYKVLSVTTSNINFSLASLEYTLESMNVTNSIQPMSGSSIFGSDKLTYESTVLSTLIPSSSFFNNASTAPSVEVLSTHKDFFHSVSFSTTATLGSFLGVNSSSPFITVDRKTSLEELTVGPTVSSRYTPSSSSTLCPDNYCENNGSCTGVFGSPSFICNCKLGFTGERCETYNCTCNKQGGRCVQKAGGGYQCVCKVGYSGTYCETSIPDCRIYNCSDSGFCQERTLDGYVCVCNASYYGQRCEKRALNCSSSLCQNGAICVDIVGDFKCLCAPGYQGQFCQFDYNECGSSPCMNNGICREDAINSFTCVCPPGTMGDLCQLTITTIVSQASTTVSSYGSLEFVSSLKSGTQIFSTALSYSIVTVVRFSSRTLLLFSETFSRSSKANLTEVLMNLTNTLMPPYTSVVEAKTSYGSLTATEQVSKYSIQSLMSSEAMISSQPSIVSTRFSVIRSTTLPNLSSKMSDIYPTESNAVIETSLVKYSNRSSQHMLASDSQLAVNHSEKSSLVTQFSVGYILPNSSRQTVDFSSSEYIPPVFSSTKATMVMSSVLKTSATHLRSYQSLGTEGVSETANVETIFTPDEISTNSLIALTTRSEELVFSTESSKSSYFSGVSLSINTYSPTNFADFSSSLQQSDMSVTNFTSSLQQSEIKLSLSQQLVTSRTNKVSALSTNEFTSTALALHNSTIVGTMPSFANVTSFASIVLPTLRPTPTVVPGVNLTCQDSPCNGQVCINETSMGFKYRCICPYPLFGPRCSSGVVIHFPLFSEGSYVRYDGIRFDEVVNTIILTFRTTKPSGLLLYAGHTSYQDFIQLSISQAKVAFLLNTGDKTVSLEHESVVNTGHLIMVTARYDSRTQTATLLVNGSSPVSKQLTSSLTSVQITTPLYMGSIPTSFQPILAGGPLPFTSFVGCIKDLQINDKPHRVVDAQDWLSINECDVPACVRSPCKNNASCIQDESKMEEYQCRCGTGFLGPDCAQREDHCQGDPCNGGVCVWNPVGYSCLCQYGRHGTACKSELNITVPTFSTLSNYSSYIEYAWIDTLRNAAERLEVRMQFKIGVPNGNASVSGLLVYAGQSIINAKGDDFFALGLSESRVVLLFSLGGGVAVVTSSHPIERSRTWHRVVAGRQGLNGFVHLDDYPAVYGRSAGVLVGLDVYTPLYIGGAPDFAKLPDYVRAYFSSGFTGSLYDVAIRTNQYTFVPLSFMPVSRTPSTAQDFSVERGLNVGDDAVDECQSEPCANNGTCTHAGSQFFCSCVYPWKGVLCRNRVIPCVEYNPCAPGSMCFTQGTDIRCDCPVGKGGEFCDQAVSIELPLFQERSFVALRPLNVKTSTSVFIRFKSSQPNGVLFYVCADIQSGTGDFFLISLLNRYINVRFSLGGSTGVLKSRYQININAWHAVNVIRDEKEAVMQLDNNPLYGTRTSGNFVHLTVSSLFYLGGVPQLSSLSSRTKIDVESQQDFQGCIAALTINNVVYNLSSAKDMVGRNIGNCGGKCKDNACASESVCSPTTSSSVRNYTCACKAGWEGDDCSVRVVGNRTSARFSGSSYILYEATDKNALADNSIEVTVNTTQNGLILWLGQLRAGSQDYLALGIKNGSVFLSIRISGSKAEGFSDVNVTSGVPQKIGVLRSGNAVTLTVDKFYFITVNTAVQTLNTFGITYIGGVDGDPSILTEGLFNTGLDGCIAELRLSHNSLPFNFNQVSLKSHNIKTCG